MARKYEHISTGGGFQVENTVAGVPSVTTVIPQTGYTLEPVGGSVFPSVSPKATVQAQTGDATLTTADMSKNQTNTGASGTITLTLPAAADCIGKAMRVQLTVAQIVRLDPAGSEKIYLGGSGVAGKYLNIAAVIGNMAEIYSDGTDWLVTRYAGVLTKEA